MSPPTPAPTTTKQKQRYGIAEWYGQLFRNLGDSERKALADVKSRDVPCPYMSQVPTLGPKNGKLRCNKSSGVCSIRNFHEIPNGATDLSYGPITATCPNRFLENAAIVEHVARVVLETDNPLFAKELPFLKRPSNLSVAVSVEETEEEMPTPSEGVEDAGSEDVGRIDLVFVDSNAPDKWCAVEIQAVYFSGGKISEDVAAIRAHSGNTVPLPAVARRPDFRSSGPKRLMPQLMIKVPTLRRWGKKMVVIIDEPFFRALESMESVEHISNCDIVWVVVRFDDTDAIGQATLVVANTVFTTLEDAVVGLTAGRPTNLSEFEKKLSSKVRPVFDNSQL